MKKRVSIIGIVGIPAKYGGFETLVEHLVRQLGDRIDFTVYCSSKHYKTKPKSYNGSKLEYLPLNANGLSSILYDALSIFKSIRKSDALLILGVSGAIVLPLIRLFSKRTIIVNIDGLEWKRDKWPRYAKAFLRLSERIAVKFSDVVISDNKAIQEYIFNEYGSSSELIEYGADHVLKPSSCGAANYAFSVCRIEPENNIHIILEAFSQITYPIKIVGNWEANEYARNLYEKYSEKINIELLDPIYEQAKLDSLRGNCTLYIHGHSAGGTNPSLVEAMILGLPVFAYNVVYNRYTTESLTYYFSDVSSLIGLLEKKDIDRRAIGDNMRAIAERRYRWSIIAEKYEALF